MTDKERSRKIIEQERKRECYTRLRRVVSPQKCVRLWLVVGSYAKATIGDFTEEIVHQSRKIENVRSQSSLWHPLSPIRTDDPANNRFLPRVRQRGRGTPCAPYVFLKTMELNCRILSFHRWNEFCKRVFPFGRIFSNFEKKFFFSFFYFGGQFWERRFKKRARRRYNQALFMGRKYVQEDCHEILIHSAAPHVLSHATSHAGIWSEVRKYEWKYNIYSCKI